MAMAMVLSRAQLGMEAPQVHVEVDLGSGLPAFAIVGLPEAVVKESKDRVRAAIRNSNFEFPDGRITVNLSPADLPKEGGRFDLPIALAILLASGQLPAGSLDRCEVYGELSLNGEVRPVRGALLAAVAAARADLAMIVPPQNAAEARLASECRIAVAHHLLSVAAHAAGSQPLDFRLGVAPAMTSVTLHDLSDVQGQTQAKRALEIAAAGEHSLLMIGPPGAGKSMLAQRLPGLLPQMTESEALEVAAVRSVAGLPIKVADWRTRPFRSPHHTASAIALVGGGAVPRPGEISLAHRGVLFLDELPEFDRRALEVLREPLENGVDHRFARGASGGVSSFLSIHRSDESVSLRLSRRRARQMSLHIRARRSLSGALVRTVARPPRLAHRGCARAAECVATRSEGPGNERSRRTARAVRSRVAGCPPGARQCTAERS